MSNHKARFRGDIQVDGSILGPDGEPVSEGGSVDVSALLPLDGSRPMTAPIHFAGGDNGEAFGPNLGWDDDDWFGLLLSPQPGHLPADNFTDLYLVVNGPTAQSFMDLSVAENYPPYINMVYTPTPSGTYVYNTIDAGSMAGYSQLLPSDVLEAQWYFGGGYVGQAQVGLVNGGDRDFLSVKRFLENDYRLKIASDGSLHWGGGAAAPDVSLQYSGAKWLTLTAQELDIVAGANGAIFILEDEDWNNYGQYGVKGMEFDYPGGYTTLHVNSNQPQFWMQDTHAIINWIPQQQHFDYQADDPTHQFMDFSIIGEDNPRFKLDQNGRLQWGPGSTGLDTHLKRRAAGILELEETGGGLVLHSPDGTAYKISVANGGALSAVAA